MRWTTKSTWLRLALLFGTLLGIPAVLMWLINTVEPTGGMIFLPVFFFLFPVIVIALAVWDGVKEGFSLLWLIYPALFWLAPTFLVFNDSALVYGVVYSVLAVVGNGVGALVRSRTRKD